MKKYILIIVSVSAFFLLNTCALEIANVIGPDGGYVFYDKGSYNYGWRYIQCSSYDFGDVGSLTDGNVESVKAALKLCSDNIAEWHKFGWELPTEAHLKKMLECFSYGLTRFSDAYYYFAVNKLYDAGRWWVCTVDGSVKNRGNYCSNCGEEAPLPAAWIVDEDDPPDPNNLTDPANPDNWEVVIFHKNFSEAANGVVERVYTLPEGAVARVRAIRRF
ncbi:MAG: hypothetical protein FWB77_00995 [Treponema sp.]|nr:hypothetical protein [Treponema sp.]